MDIFIIVYYIYKYDSQEKDLSIVANATGLYDKYDSSSNNIENNGLACKMVYKSSKDIIECVYFMKKSSYYSYVSLALFYISNTNIVTYKNTIHYSYSNIKFFSSAVNSDFSRIIYCFYDSTGKTICKYYDYNYDQGLTWTLNEKCSTNNYAMNTYYFPETQEFAVSCLLLNGGIGFVFFNKDIEEVTRYEYKYTDCTQIISHSLLYSTNKEKFYVLSDVQCNGNIYYEKVFDDGTTDEIDNEEDGQKVEEEEEEEEEEEKEKKEEEEERKEEED